MGGGRAPRVDTDKTRDTGNAKGYVSSEVHTWHSLGFPVARCMGPAAAHCVLPAAEADATTAPRGLLRSGSKLCQTP